MTTTKGKIHSEAHKGHWIEWITGILSAALVAALIGWIGYEALTYTPEEPNFMLEVTGTAKAASGWSLAFTIDNKSNTTASAVVVEGTLTGSESTQTSDVTFDYVPAQSQASGALFFDENPAKGKTTIRVVGYTDP